MKNLIYDAAHTIAEASSPERDGMRCPKQDEMERQRARSKGAANGREGARNRREQG